MSQNFPQTAQIAHFALQAGFPALTPEVTDQLKKHLLYAAGSLFYALDQPAPQKLARQIKAFSAGGYCTVPVIGPAAPDRAAQFYTALVGYPGCEDDFLAKGAFCHPCYNTGALLAAAQWLRLSGSTFLTAMAVAYEVECRLATELPVLDRGFDDSFCLAVSLAAALSKLAGLTEEQAAHAIGMAGVAFTPLGVNSAAYTYEWKGLSASLTALGCMNVVFLAREGVTGPLHLFEGAKGWKDVLDKELKYHWEKDRFDLIKQCALKKHAAGVHLQSLVEAVLELRRNLPHPVEEIDAIDVKTFLTAYHLAGGGDFGSRKEVYTREQAVHSIPYVMAVALADGQAGPEQFGPESISRPEVQHLLKKVTVHTASLLHHPVSIAGLLDPYAEAYPEALLGKVTVRFRNGKELAVEKEDYPGFYTRPLSWHEVTERFRHLSAGAIGRERQDRVLEVISDLENREVLELTDLLLPTRKETIIEGR